MDIRETSKVCGVVESVVQLHGFFYLRRFSQVPAHPEDATMLLRISHAMMIMCPNTHKHGRYPS